MNKLNWDDIPPKPMSALQSRQVIHAPESTIVRLVSLKGTVVPSHHHVHKQVVLLESGAVRFEMQGKTTVLRRGDVLGIESDVPHQAEALEDSVTIEIFFPARTDWIGEGQPILAGSIEEPDRN